MNTNAQTHAQLRRIVRTATARTRRPSTAHIHTEIYVSLADELRDRINDQPYHRSSRTKTIHGEEISIEVGEYVCSLVISAVIHLNEHTAPDGSWTTIDKVVPTWCEFHVYRGSDASEVYNDFEFRKLERHI